MSYVQGASAQPGRRSPLTYDEVTPSPRNAEAIVAIAHWLHPSAFGLRPSRRRLLTGG
jgi:hypothetical protein